MAITKKQDWMNDYLAKNDFLVSSHLSMNKKLNLDEAWDVSIRFIGNANMGYSYLIVIIVEEDPYALRKIKDNPKILDLINILKGKISTNINIILCGKENNSFTSYVSPDNIIFSKFDENSLVSYFQNIDQKFTQDVGTNKAINKSVNDIFQIWTREKLSKYITINDFDALYIKNDNFYIFELKRINPKINKLEEWRPYCNDYGNYRACNIIRQQCNLTNDNFRTLAYTLEDNSKVSIFTFDSINKVSFSGNFDTLAPEQIFQALKKNFQGCK